MAGAGKIAIIGAGVTAAAAGIAAYHIYSNVEFTTGKPIKESFAFDEFGFSFKIPFAVNNKSFITIPFKKFTGIIELGKDDYLADLLIDQPIDIKPNTAATGNITVFVDYAEVLQELTDILRDKQFLQDATVKGLIKTPYFSIPVRKKLLELR